MHLRFCLSLVLIPISALAQTLQLGRAPTCGDFTRNSDGSWSSSVSLAIKGTIVGPETRLQRGVPINGIDLAALLDEQCATARADTPVMLH